MRWHRLEEISFAVFYCMVLKIEMRHARGTLTLTLLVILQKNTTYGISSKQQMSKVLTKFWIGVKHKAYCQNSLDSIKSPSTEAVTKGAHNEVYNNLDEKRI